MRKLAVYGCGGCGINIAAGLSKYSPIENAAPIEITYVDTSRSNLAANDIAENKAYLVKGKDGSGKERSLNHTDISDIINDVLLKHKPEDMNIVIFSLSGGSGSVIGPLIIRELLKRGMPVIGLVVGSTESTKTSENTLATFKSLDNIADKVDLPLVVGYELNESGRTQSAVDSSMISVCRSLSILSSGNNQGLDSQDLIHWLQYSKLKSAKAKPGLAFLNIYQSAEHVEQQHPAPISVASLYLNKDIPPLPVTCDYHCTGYVDIKRDGFTELHYVIDVNQITEEVNKIKTIISKHVEQTSARPRMSSLVDDSDDVSDDGLVL